MNDTVVDAYEVLINGLYGFIDSNGNIIKHPIFESTGSHFENGLCVVVINSRYKFINDKFTFEFPTSYDEAYTFSNGTAAVKINGLWGFINRHGKIIIEPQFDEVSSFDKDGLASVCTNDKWGYIDMKGNFTIPPIFDIAYYFHNNLAKVVIDRKTCYINRSGKIIWQGDTIF